MLQEFLREHSPKVYGMCSYTALDISKELSLRQQSRIAEAGHGEERFSVRQGDALQPEAWGQPSNRLTYVVMCEVIAAFMCFGRPLHCWDVQPM